LTIQISLTFFLKQNNTQATTSPHIPKMFIGFYDKASTFLDFREQNGTGVESANGFYHYLYRKPTVDGSGIRRSPVDMVNNIPLFTSQVVQDFFHRQYLKPLLILIKTPTPLSKISNLTHSKWGCLKAEKDMLPKSSAFFVNQKFRMVPSFSTHSSTC